MEKRKYRLLTRQDAIRATDEFLDDDCETWNGPVGWEVGLTYDPSVYVPARREIEAKG